MDMNDLVSYVLRIGIVASILLIAVGLVFLFATGGSNGFTLNQIASSNTIVNSSRFSTPAIINGLPRYQGLDFILLGIIVLVATPVMRVFLSILAFLREKNWIYAAITLIVFADLMVAIFVVPGLLAH